MLREGKDKYGRRSLSGTLTCPKCGKSGDVSFCWKAANDSFEKAYMRKFGKEGPGYWHIVATGPFGHDENSLGGAETFCCVDICAPNGVQYPDDDD